MDKNSLPKVATTCTEDRNKQTTKIGYNMYREWTQKDCQMWLQHVQSMDKHKLPKLATTCTEVGHNHTNECGYNMYNVWTKTDY